MVLQHAKECTKAATQESCKKQAQQELAKQQAQWRGGCWSVVWRNKVEIKQKMLEALRLLRQADQALNEVCKYFNDLTKDVWTSRSTNTKEECKGELKMSTGELTRKQDGCLSQLLEWSHIWVRRVLWAVKHGSQEVCTVNKVCKYHSMCEMVESVHAAVETQRRGYSTTKLLILSFLTFKWLPTYGPSQCVVTNRTLVTNSQPLHLFHPA